MKALFVPSMLLMLAACASDRVDYGGVLNPASFSGYAESCHGGDRERVSYRSPEYPPELQAFLYSLHSDMDERRLRFSYDIEASGQPVNIRYIGDERYIHHDSFRTAVRAGAEAIADWRYQPGEQAVVDCTVSMNFVRPGRGMSVDEAYEATQ